MNSKQRHQALRAANRVIETYCRSECVRLGLDPEKWASYCFDHTPVQKECSRKIRFLPKPMRQPISKVSHHLRTRDEIDNQLLDMLGGH